MSRVFIAQNGRVRRRLVAAIGAAAVGIFSMAFPPLFGRTQSPPPDGPTESGRAETEATLRQYCVTCHNAGLNMGGLALDPADVVEVGSHAETFEKVLRQLRGATMPPPGQPRPEAAVYRRVSEYLIRELETAAATEPNPGELSAAHRLTRTEYRNAVRDLLALGDLPKEMDFDLLLPADNVSSGFDNLADTLFVSPVTLERYMNAARKISRIAVGDLEMGTLVNVFTTSLREPQEARNPKLPFGTQGGVALDTYFPLDGEYDFEVEIGQALPEPHQLEITIDGRRHELVPLEGARARVGRARRSTKQFRLAIPAGPRTVGVTFLERSQALSEAPLRPPARRRGELPSVARVTIGGPYNITGPGDTPSRRRIFVCRPSGPQDELLCAQRILRNLVRQAYRRPASEADVAYLLPFYKTGHAEGGFDKGIQKALERLLVSPQFLFRIEREPEGAVPGSAYPVGDLELASRLSFFIWSSIPDDELLDLAESGQLRNSDVLARQVQRMLADSRSESMVSNFAAQWLFLRDLEGKEPDLYLFRDFDEGLRAAFLRETELFVGDILRSDQSVLDLLSANYTYLNERLASHYNIPNVTGSRLRKVALPAGSPRGGLLGHGSILLLTSYATRTSPVLRGKYVLENLLSSPPPPPPPDVPSLDISPSADAEPLSMREAMLRHRADPACAGCHSRMDPIGFALENFDAVGRWRDQDGGNPIDVVSSLPDGTTVEGLDGVKHLLLDNPGAFVESLTGKLLMYALGRNVQYYDGPAIRAIAREAANESYTFASLVLGVVNSVPFQNRMARD